MKLDDPELLIPFKMNGSFAEFTTWTPTEDEIRDLFDDRIELTDHNTWDPVNLSAPCKVSATVSSNVSAIQRLKKMYSLKVCGSVLPWNETRVIFRMVEINVYCQESQPH